MEHGVGTGRGAADDYVGMKNRDGSENHLPPPHHRNFQHHRGHHQGHVADEHDYNTSHQGELHDLCHDIEPFHHRRQQQDFFVAGNADRRHHHQSNQHRRHDQNHAPSTSNEQRRNWTGKRVAPFPAAASSLSSPAKKRRSGEVKVNMVESTTSPASHAEDKNRGDAVDGGNRNGSVCTPPSSKPLQQHQHQQQQQQQQQGSINKHELYLSIAPEPPAHSKFLWSLRNFLSDGSKVCFDEPLNINYLKLHYSNSPKHSNLRGSVGGYLELKTHRDAWHALLILKREKFFGPERISVKLWDKPFKPVRCGGKNRSNGGNNYFGSIGSSAVDAVGDVPTDKTTSNNLASKTVKLYPKAYRTIKISGIPRNISKVDLTTHLCNRFKTRFVHLGLQELQNPVIEECVVFSPSDDHDNDRNNNSNVRVSSSASSFSCACVRFRTDAQAWHALLLDGHFLGKNPLRIRPHDPRAPPRVAVDDVDDGINDNEEVVIDRHASSSDECAHQGTVPESSSTIMTTAQHDKQELLSSSEGTKSTIHQHEQQERRDEVVVQSIAQKGCRQRNDGEESSQPRTSAPASSPAPTSTKTTLAARQHEQTNSNSGSPAEQYCDGRDNGKQTNTLPRDLQQQQLHQREVLSSVDKDVTLESSVPQKDDSPSCYPTNGKDDCSVTKQIQGELEEQVNVLRQQLANCHEQLNEKIDLEERLQNDKHMLVSKLTEKTQEVENITTQHRLEMMIRQTELEHRQSIQQLELQQTVQRATTEYQRISKEKMDESDKVRCMTIELDKVNGENATLKQDLDEQRQAAHNAYNDVATLRDEMEQLKSDHSLEVYDMERVQKELSESQSCISFLQQQLEESNTKIVALTNEKSHLLQELHQRRQEAAEAELQRRELQKVSTITMKQEESMNNISRDATSATSASVKVLEEKLENSERRFDQLAASLARQADMVSAERQTRMTLWKKLKDEEELRVAAEEEAKVLRQQLQQLQQGQGQQLQRQGQESTNEKKGESIFLFQSSSKERSDDVFGKIPKVKKYKSENKKDPQSVYECDDSNEKMKQQKKYENEQSQDDTHRPNQSTSENDNNDNNGNDTATSSSSTHERLKIKQKRYHKKNQVVEAESNNINNTMVNDNNNYNNYNILNAEAAIYHQLQQEHKQQKHPVVRRRVSYHYEI